VHRFQSFLQHPLPASRSPALLCLSHKLAFLETRARPRNGVHRAQFYHLYLSSSGSMHGMLRCGGALRSTASAALRDAAPRPLPGLQHSLWTQRRRPEVSAAAGGRGGARTPVASAAMVSLEEIDRARVAEGGWFVTEGGQRQWVRAQSTADRASARRAFPAPLLSFWTVPAEVCIAGGARGGRRGLACCPVACRPRPAALPATPLCAPSLCGATAKDSLALCSARPQRLRSPCRGVF
jgi:hypothetical protein